jgi:hypothetical protein
MAPGHLFAPGMNLAIVEKCSTIVGICGLLIAEFFYNYSIKRRTDLCNYSARLQSGHRTVELPVQHLTKKSGDCPISSFHSKGPAPSSLSVH